MRLHSVSTREERSRNGGWRYGAHKQLFFWRNDLEDWLTKRGWRWTRRDWPYTLSEKIGDVECWALGHVGGDWSSYRQREVCAYCGGALWSER